MEFDQLAGAVDCISLGTSQSSQSFSQHRLQKIEKTLRPVLKSSPETGVTARNIIEQLRVFGYLDQLPDQLPEQSTDGHKSSDEDEGHMQVESLKDGKRKTIPIPPHFRPRSIKTREQIKEERRRNVTLNNAKIRHYAVKRGLPLSSKQLLMTFEIEAEPVSRDPPNSPSKRPRISCVLPPDSPTRALVHGVVCPRKPVSRCLCFE